MKSELLTSIDLGNNTKSFIIRPEKNFTYLPGQYIYLSLPSLKHPDTRGNTRPFTISSSPTEGNNITITTKIRADSGFKHTLGELATRSTLDIRGPYGDFSIDRETQGQHVFIAGGIGITPFRSMLRFIADSHLNGINVYLLYSASTPEELVFNNEFVDISNNYPNIKLYTTVTKPKTNTQKWMGNMGRINDQVIRSFVPNFQKATFWLCGPPAMVDAFLDLLPGLSIPPESIKFEKFTGY